MKSVFLALLVLMTPLAQSEECDESLINIDGQFIQSLVASSGFLPRHLLNELKKDSELEELFAGDSGVRERYTIEEHTVQVYDVFFSQMKYFDFDLDVGLNPGRLRPVITFVISLHDIGKPIAVELGNKSRQHEFTVPIIKRKMSKYDFAPEEVQLAEALLGDDFIGEVLQGKVSVDHAVEEIKSTAEEIGVSPQNYFRLLSFFFKIDAGSYPFLRRVVFQSQSLREELSLDHSEPYQELLARLGF